MRYGMLIGLLILNGCSFDEQDVSSSQLRITLDGGSDEDAGTDEDAGADEGCVVGANSCRHPYVLSSCRENSNGEPTWFDYPCLRGEACEHDVCAVSVPEAVPQVHCIHESDGSTRVQILGLRLSETLWSAPDHPTFVTPYGEFIGWDPIDPDQGGERIPYVGEGVYYQFSLTEQVHRFNFYVHHADDVQKNAWFDLDSNGGLVGVPWIATGACVIDGTSFKVSSVVTPTEPDSGTQDTETPDAGMDSGVPDAGDPEPVTEPTMHCERLESGHMEFILSGDIMTGLLTAPHDTPVGIALFGNGLIPWSSADPFTGNTASMGYEEWNDYASEVAFFLPTAANNMNGAVITENETHWFCIGDCENEVNRVDYKPWVVDGDCTIEGTLIRTH